MRSADAKAPARPAGDAETQDALHEELLSDIAEQLAPIFDGTSEGVYVFLDDRHKICNDVLAKMWGFPSASEWARTPDFLNAFVASHEDRLKVSRTYHEHIHQTLTPTRLRFTVRRPDGKLVRSETDMIPFSHRGQLLAYHFVRIVPGPARRSAPRRRSVKAAKRKSRAAAR